MNTNTIKLLVIDDDEIGREQVQRYMRASKLDFEVSEAGNFIEGRARLEQSEVDCILLDYHLGDGTAFELIDQLRKDNPNFETPVILLTGAGSEEVAVKALKLGICDYINKDRLDAHGLEQAIRTALAERRLAQAEADHREALEHRSMHDDLTELPNRRLFLDRLEQRILNAERSGEGFSLFVVDLDRFKMINDTFGHNAGDAVLTAVGGRMLKLARKSDTYARMGGDEFAVLLSNSESVDGAITVAQRLAETIVQPVSVDNSMVNVDVSIGIALYPDHGHSAIELMAHADEAMYEAKRSAQRFAVYSGENDAPLHENARISMELPGLAASDQIELHYQPKYDLQNGQIVGVEALARWHHAELGNIPPDRFIPIIERSKFIVDFTQACLRKALKQTAAWRTQGLNFPVAVNVSPRALEAESFLDSVELLLDEFSLGASDLIVEITETASLNHYDRSAQVLVKMAERGIGVSIDDFGTGYTSLRYLREFPATELKIDRLFVAETVAGGRDYSLISGIVRLAKGIGAKTVGEGIETADTLHALIELGCDYGQGFYLAHPAAAAEISKIAANSKSNSTEAAVLSAFA